MKAFLLIVIFFVSSYSYAQSDKKHWVYGSVDLIAGNYYGIGSSLNYIRNEKLSLALGGFGSRKEAASKPDNYTGGIISIGPHDRFRNYHLLLGRAFRLTDNTRFNLSGGLGYATLIEPVNWERINSFLFGPNYTYDFIQFHNFSLIIHPKLEFGSAKSGFALSGLFVFTEKRNLFGVSLSGLIGKPGDRRVKKDKSKDEMLLIKNSNDESGLNEN